MYKDVQNLNNVDKQMLNQLVNENVIPFTKKILHVRINLWKRKIEINGRTNLES